MGAIDELIGYDHVARSEVFLQGSDGGHGNQPAHVEAPHRPDVRGVGNFLRHQMVMATVTGQEDDLHALQSSETQRVRWTPERGFQGAFFQLLKAGHGVQTAATDHADPGAAQIHRLSHPGSAPYTPVLLAAP